MSNAPRRGRPSPRQDVQILLDRIAKLEAKALQDQAEVRRLKQDVARVLKEHDALKASNRELRPELHKARAQLQRLLLVNASLTDSVTQATREVTELRRQRDEAVTRLEGVLRPPFAAGS